MPIYEYACALCGHSFEEWLPQAGAAASQPCPLCGQNAQRVLSNTTFILKGGGWYATDYGKQKEERAQAAPAEAGGASQDGKAESKNENSGSASGQDKGGESGAPATPKAENAASGNSLPPPAKPAAQAGAA